TVDFPTNIPAQPAERPDVVTVVEKWESLDHLEAHLIAPHMLAYRARVKEMIAGVSIQVLEPA
ncbi:MAG: antibiotic biosynthesis monooxygenase, partial [Planctomycetales bacterium]|nr:antibiotic biosynthesis monooxygenase [Planctomycetales bacterium]